VPKSHVRKKKVYTPPAEVRPVAESARRRPSSPWVPATGSGLIVLGILWLVLFYTSDTKLPVEAWGYWNLAVGFGAMVASLAVLTRWH